MSRLRRRLSSFRSAWRIDSLHTSIWTGKGESAFKKKALRKRTKRELRQIEALIRLGRLGKARKLLRRIHSAGEHRPRQLKKLRVLALALGEEKVALRVSIILIKRRPDNTKAWDQRIQLLLHRGQRRAALRQARRAPASVGLRTFSEADCENAVDARLPSLETLAQEADFSTVVAALRRHNFQKGFDQLDACIEQLEKTGEQEQAADLLSWRNQLRLSCLSPELVHAWRASFQVPSGRETFDSGPIPPVIQYWSQGDLPKEFRYIQRRWQKLLNPYGIKQWIHFDRNKALAWIESEAPEFLVSFHSAFHYAVEADVFRIAYASREPLIWLDADLFPTPSAGRFLRRALNRNISCVLTRPFAPYLLNGFFTSTPSCRFIQNLAAQCAGIDFSELPRTGRTITSTFGCQRFIKVLSELCREAHECEGSVLKGTNWGIQFANTRSFASSKPPLAYTCKSRHQSSCTDE